MVKRGSLSHESPEIIEVIHDSRKFFEVFHVSRNINAVWNNYPALGTISSDRRSLPNLAVGLGALLIPQWVQGSTLMGVPGTKPPETSEIWHFRGTK